MPQLKGEKGNPRKWVYFHFEPMSPRVDRKARFIRDMRWKLYDDGSLFDLDSDPDEEYPIQARRDKDDQADARKRLEPIFAQMVPETPPVR